MGDLSLNSLVRELFLMFVLLNSSMLLFSSPVFLLNAGLGW